MNILKTAYKQALEEDAVMAAGDSAPISDISAPVEPSDNSIITHPGTSRDDVLGPYKPGKGVFGKDDFNIPKNILGKGNILKRMGYPSKKPKNHKNPYIDNMKIISEDIESIIKWLSETDLDEDINTSYSQIETFNGLKSIKSKLNSPDDVIEFIKLHQKEFDEFKTNKNLTAKQKTVFSRILDSIKYALKQGIEFIKKHWFKILMLILIIVAIIWFGQTERGIHLGTKLFGDGYGKVANGIKEYGKGAISTIKSFLTQTNSSRSTTLDKLIKAKHWNPISDDLVNYSSPSTGLKTAVNKSQQVWQWVLKDGRNAYSFGEDPTVYLPEF